MARHKYKLGTLVKLKDGKTGVVDGILTTELGFSYRIQGEFDFFTEDSVECAYRQMTERKPRIPKPKVQGKSKKENTKSLNS